ncbi:MAG TPA: hypothetical protein VFQ71_00170 [Gaiellales bacterium]|nr:hypothetical protein [Gaiellales bacterium]
MRSIIPFHSVEGRASRPHPARESEHEYFMRAARERALTRRRERRAKLVRKLTGRRPETRRAA